jgi:hypothetical protein
MGCTWTFDIQRTNANCVNWLDCVFKLRKYLNAKLVLGEPMGGQDEFSEFRVRMHQLCEMIEAARAQPTPAPVAPAPPVVLDAPPAPLVSALPTGSSGTTLSGSNGAPPDSKLSPSPHSHPTSYRPRYPLAVLPAASSHFPYLLQTNSVLTMIDGFSLANKGKQRARTDPADPSYAFAGNTTRVPAITTPGSATQAPAANLTKTAILATSKEDIKTSTGFYAPSPVHSSACLKAMFAHPGFESLRNTSKLTLESCITNRLTPDCPENTFLSRACEYFTANKSQSGSCCRTASISSTSGIACASCTRGY